LYPSRYEGEPPLGFVDDILKAVVARDVAPRGLYIGCGNGRNYAPLVDAGLDLVGLDVSQAAITQLAEKQPDRRHRLVCGDLEALTPETKYPLVIGIQVFQHGDRDSAHAHIQAAKSRVMDEELICVRVNAVGTDIEYEHQITERHPDGGFTIRYLKGAKSGLLIHFFSHDELASLFTSREEVLPMRVQETWREPRSRGRWLQWEAIC
jgi:SAM-dependent methyltransferase